MKKVFFGWYIVAASLLLATYNSAMYIYGFTTFVTPIAATFGWGLAQISLALSLRGLETGTLDPLIGVAADRWPARRLMLIGICLFALGTFCISQSTNLAMFYMSFLIVGLGGAICISMVPMIVIARWFKKNVGKASGILAVGFGAGGLFAPLLVNAIDAYGWQTTMVYLTVGMLILGIPLSFLFRSRPEEYGLLPDGTAQGDIEGSSTYDFSMEPREALKTQAFWSIGIATMLQMTALNAVAVHQMPYLTSLGMERAGAAVVVLIFSMVTLVSRLTFGFLADIFPKKHVMALSLGLTSAGLLIFELIDVSSFAFIVLYAVVYGFGSGGATPLRMPITREYFGTKKFGTIFGLLTVFTMFGTVSGAPVAGWVFDTGGAYEPIWLIFGGLNMIAMILILTLPAPLSKSSPVAS